MDRSCIPHWEICFPAFRQNPSKPRVRREIEKSQVVCPVSDDANATQKSWTQPITRQDPTQLSLQNSFVCCARKIIYRAFFFLSSESWPYLALSRSLLAINTKEIHWWKEKNKKSLNGPRPTTSVPNNWHFNGTNFSSCIAKRPHLTFPLSPSRMAHENSLSLSDVLEKERKCRHSYVWKFPKPKVMEKKRFCQK
jgi:hypothetical protein